MIRLSRVVVLLMLMLGFLSQTGAAAAACQSGVMDPRNDTAMPMNVSGDSMAGMLTGASNAADTTNPDSCPAPEGSHACSTMSACATSFADGFPALNKPRSSVPQCPRSIVSLEPESRSALPELPPPRA